MAGVGVEDQRMFSDIHSFLENAMGELSRMKDTMETNELRHQQGCDGMRKELEKERFEARESTNKFRYEFDEMVHKRVETVLEGLEEMEQNQKYKDRQQQLQLDGLEDELKALNTNLGSVNGTWASYRHNCKGRQPLYKGAGKGTGLDKYHVKHGHRRSSRGNALEEVKRLQVKKAATHLFEIVEQMRVRVKGAAQFIHGENWAKVIRNQDKDGSGQICFKEFKHMCVHLLRVQEPEASLRIVFESLDEDHSGGISVEELVEFVADPVLRMKRRLKAAVIEKAGQAEVRAWEDLLRSQDKDGSGQMSYSEFKMMCRQVLNLLDKDVHIRQVFKALDADNSGEVSIDELIAWMDKDEVHFHLK